MSFEGRYDATGYGFDSHYLSRGRYPAPYIMGIILSVVIIMACILAIILLFAGGIAVDHEINPDGSKQSYPGGYIVAMILLAIVIVVAVVIAIWYGRLGKRAATASI